MPGRDNFYIIPVPSKEREICSIRANTMQQEKRVLQRIQFERPARIVTRSGEKRSVKSRNFSMKGAAFTCNEPLAIGEMLRLILNVGQPGRSHIMKIYGRVVHSSKKDNHYLLGICFNRKQA